MIRRLKSILAPFKLIFLPDSLKSKYLVLLAILFLGCTNLPQDQLQNKLNDINKTKYTKKTPPLKIDPEIQTEKNKQYYVKINSKNTNINTNETTRIKIEIANTSKERRKGLMNRTQLDKNSGMLFIYPDEEIRSFWMKNTYIPLDMIFINSDQKIVDIKKNASPCKSQCQKYVSNKPAQYVIEVNSGFTSKNDVEVNDTVYMGLN